MKKYEVEIHFNYGYIRTIEIETDYEISRIMQNIAENKWITSNSMMINLENVAFILIKERK